MSWSIFRAQYKQSFQDEFKSKKTAKTIADSYDLCVRTGLSGIGTAPPTPLVKGNKDLLEKMLNLSFLSFGLFKFSKALDIGLKLYWMGAKTASGATIIIPGITSAFVDREGETNKNVDEFIEQIIKSFKTHMKTITGATTSAPPLVFAGYKVLDNDKDNDTFIDEVEKEFGTDPEDRFDYPGANVDMEIYLEQMFEKDFRTYLEEQNITTTSEIHAAIDGRAFRQGAFYGNIDKSPFSERKFKNDKEWDAFFAGMGFEYQQELNRS